MRYKLNVTGSRVSLFPPTPLFDPWLSNVAKRKILLPHSIIRGGTPALTFSLHLLRYFLASWLSEGPAFLASQGIVDRPSFGLDPLKCLRHPNGGANRFRTHRGSPLPLAPSSVTWRTHGTLRPIVTIEINKLVR